MQQSRIKAEGTNDHAVERMLADLKLQSILEKTIPISKLNMEDFDAVFFPCGHGTMWDLPIDPNIKLAVESAYSNGKLIATVCHGAAGLVSAVRSDGLPLVFGKRINSFTNAEEREVGLDGIVPFMLETRLRELGCVFEASDNWQPFAIQDGQLITGQNPQSSALVTEMLVSSIRIKHSE